VKTNLAEKIKETMENLNSKSSEITKSKQEVEELKKKEKELLKLKEIEVLEKQNLLEAKDKES
jgi:hypothetical protein